MEPVADPKTRRHPVVEWAYVGLCLVRDLLKLPAQKWNTAKRESLGEKTRKKIQDLGKAVDFTYRDRGGHQ